MEITYEVELAVCLVNGTWYGATQLIYLDDDSGDGHTEGEIWEAAHDSYLLKFSGDTRILTIGLINYEMIKKEEA